VYDGKEGVDGSSPSEGLRKVPATCTLLLSVRRTRGHIPDTSTVPATHRDISRRLLTRLAGTDATRFCGKPLLIGHSRCLNRRGRDPLRAREGVARVCVRPSRTPVCHAGGRGFESRRSRKNPCKLAYCVVGSDARFGPTTQARVRRGPKQSKPVRNASRGHDFKPFSAASTPAANPACDYAK
jgi:hypothetical protein